MNINIDNNFIKIDYFDGNIYISFMPQNSKTRRYTKSLIINTISFELFHFVQYKLSDLLPLRQAQCMLVIYFISDSRVKK